MTILYINTGSSPNSGNGDSLRTAFNKVNSSLSYLDVVTLTTASQYILNLQNTISSIEYSIPHAVSSLTNDVGYLTSSTLGQYVLSNSLSGWYLSSSTGATVSLTQNSPSNASFELNSSTWLVIDDPDGSALWIGGYTFNTSTNLIYSNSDPISIYSTNGMNLYNYETVDSGFSETITLGESSTPWGTSGTTGTITLSTMNGSYNWIFGVDGSTIFPTGQALNFVNGNARIQSGMGFHISSEEGVSIEAVNISTTVTHTWVFDPYGNVTFPDATVQSTAYQRVSLPPKTSWGNYLTIDSFTFFFDPTTGVPSFQGGAGGGSGAGTNTIWSIDVYQSSAGSTSTINGSYAYNSGIPIQITNITPMALTSSPLQSSDYAVMRVQDLDNNKAYVVNFLGSYNINDTVTPTQYGTISAERIA